METVIAAIQMSSTDQVEDNLKMAQLAIQQAAAANATFVALPENFALMSSSSHSLHDCAEPLGKGKIQEWLSEQARTYQIYLLGGSIPQLIIPANPKVFSTSLLFNPAGECISHYQKIHLFDVGVGSDTLETHCESAVIEPGETITVVTTDLGRIGLSICYDLRFPELYRRMHQQGVDLVCIPAAFTEKTGQAHWEILIRARAIENLCYVIAPGQCGLHSNGRRTYGHSMIVDPWGVVLAQAGTQPAVIYAKMNNHYLQHLRKVFPVLTHRKVSEL